MHCRTPIRDVFPQARPLSLGGREVMAGELTLADLAVLDLWLASSVGDPMAGVPPAGADPDPATRRGRMLAAWHCLADRPELGGEAGAYLCGTDAGRAVVLLLASARGGAPLTHAEAMEAVAAATREEWAAFDRAAWGVPEWRALARELDPDFDPPGEDGPAEPFDWGKALCDVAGGDPAKLLACRDLTVSQFKLLCREGRPDHYEMRPRDGETPAELMARYAATFTAEGGDTSGPSCPSPGAPPPA